MLFMIVERFKNGDPVPVTSAFANAAAWPPRACITCRGGSTRRWRLAIR
jgi:hypothetical protein